MDQFSTIPTWISAIAAAGSVIFTIISWRQSNGSKEAKAKADEAHKAALAMSAAAERSAKAAKEQANQAELARKAAEERVRQAEKSLEQMQQLVAEQQSQSQSQSKIAASLQGPPFELTHTGEYNYLLRNTTMETLKILEVVNCNSFIKMYPEWRDRHPKFPWELHPHQTMEVYLPRDGSVLNLELEVEGKDAPIFITIPSAN